MVDPNSLHKENAVKIKSFIRSKFLAVVGSSNDLLNGISNRLDISLSLSSSSEVESNTPDNRSSNKGSFEDDDYDENVIDFESRKVKERRAYEEVKSGRYRQPNFITKTNTNEYNIVDINIKNTSSISNSNSEYSNSQTTSPIKDIDSDHLAIGTATDSLADLDTDKDDEKSDMEKMEKQLRDIVAGQPKLMGDTTSGGSGSTSENDLCLPSISQESSALGISLYSELNVSVPSWASSISLDSQSEELTRAFMKQFVKILYEDSSSITLDIKAEFGNRARTDTGRLWFARMISAQRSKSKCVNESTFYSLIQYFAIVLFESCESEDFSPAKILMNMCFTFYHEVDVPGCEPYREYIYTYLREQPIWQSLRFWNAAFFDALQCERINRPVAKSNRSSPAVISNVSIVVENKSSEVINKTIADKEAVKIKSNNKSVSPLEELDSSDIDGSVSTAASSPVKQPKHQPIQDDFIKEDQKYHQNISFGQLGTFTCNMHAFGLSRELCTEFLRKQCVIANLSKEQEKMLRDNMNRMYKETAKWRT